jgi:hypothetical protein
VQDGRTYALQFIATRADVDQSGQDSSSPATTAAVNGLAESLRALMELANVALPAVLQSFTFSNGFHQRWECCFARSPAGFAFGDGFSQSRRRFLC